MVGSPYREMGLAWYLVGDIMFNKVLIWANENAGYIIIAAVAVLAIVVVLVP